MRTLTGAILRYGQAAAVAALVLIALPAQATVIYDNGGPNSVQGNEATLWLQTEDFTLGANQSITGAGVYFGGIEGIGGWDGSLQYFVFSNAGGQPGAALTGGSGLNATVTDSGVPFGGGGNSYLLAFDFNSPFAASGGTTYWFGIHLSGDYAGQDGIYWTTTDPTTGNGTESLGGTQDNWFNNGQEHAFYLVAIPEPSTLASLGLGLAGLAALARRRRS